MTCFGGVDGRGGRGGGDDVVKSEGVAGEIPVGVDGAPLGIFADGAVDAVDVGSEEDGDSDGEGETERVVMGRGSAASPKTATTVK